MLKIIILIVFLCEFYITLGFVNVYPPLKRFNFTGDPGEPLFLTPYIDKEMIEEARKLAKNEFADFKDIESYSGFLTVDKHFKSNLFFWYFRAHSDWQNAPVLLWLQGGPGASSLFGLFTENGPFEIVSGTSIKMRKYSWHLNHNLIYIDNPVGAGFSFTQDVNGYANNEKDVAINLYLAIVQFFKLFPELEKNKFYATGESYGGKYVPALAHRIHEMNQANGTIKINLQGIAIGNGMSDPIHQLNYGDYLYQLGLIDSKTLATAHKIEKVITEHINRNEYDQAFDVMNKYIGFNTTNSLFMNATGFETHYSYYHPEDDKKSDMLAKYIQSSDVRRAIHVGNSSFNDFSTENVVLDHLKDDIFKSVAQWINDLLNHYPALIYNGQLDIICAYPMTVNYLKHLKFNGSEYYKTAERHIWRVNNQIAGYVKTAGHLTEVLVRNAGHMVPRDQPKFAFDLINRFTAGKPFF